MMSTARIRAGSILRESMSQASQLSPELARGLLQLARALLAAARNWTLYPPEHPTVAASISRLSDAIRQSTLGAIFSIGITPETLMVESTPADSSQSSIAEAAALLHDRDLLRMTFIGDVPPEAVHALLRLLSLDPAERRRRGGPAVIWAAESQPTLVLEQIDYEKVLARDEGDVPEPAKRDALWQSIVTSIAGGQTAMFDQLSQERLLAIAGSPRDIGALASAVVAPKCGMDGSPMITSQAATVLAAYRHLAGIVSVMSPDRVPEVMNNLATASLQLDPHVVMQVLQTEDDPKSVLSIVKGLGAAFDDAKVAQLLATALALEGQASDRLATIFNTIAPDEDRRRRVMTLTRSLLSETDFGKAGQFQTIWSSMEELLVSYNDKPFVSETYRASLDGIGGRAERMAVADLPPEITEWMTSLGQDNVRGLSVQLLIDLLAIEEDSARATEIARDMEALSEDLLMAGAYDDTQQVTQALAARATAKSAIGRDACRQALDQLGESLAMRETASIIGDVDEQAWKAIRSIVTTVGPSSIEALRPMVAVEDGGIASTRASETIVGFGKPAISRLAPLIGDSRWFAQRAGAILLGTIGSAEVVPLLQPLLRKSDPRVTQATVAALGKVDDPSAARAIQTVLRAATGSTRRAVVDALVVDRDPRVVPMLVRILAESEPLAKDHDVVLEAIGALATVGSDQAVPTLAGLAGLRRWFGGKKLRALKEKSVDALVTIGGERAEAALDDAAKTGDRGLKKIVAARRR
jgi:HEAT repeat protein